MFPPIYQEQLSCLLDKLTLNPINLSKKNKTNSIRLYEEKPIAAASIGQVHKASYKNNIIVVKILYPNIESQTKSDLKILKMWSEEHYPIK